MAPIEARYLSVRSLADQVGELVQAGEHGVRLDRGVNAARCNMTPTGTAYSAASPAGWLAR